MSRQQSARGVSTTFRYVALVAGALVMVTPFVYMVSTSFKAQAYVLTFPPQFIPNPATTDNYVQALTTQNFGLYFLNSIIVSVIATAASVLVSSMMAYAFARFRFPGRELIFRILLLGLIVPAMMLIIPQFILAKHLDLLDSLLGLIVFYTAGTLALNTFLLRGFFESITWELDQAAQGRGPDTGDSRCPSPSLRSRRRRSSRSSPAGTSSPGRSRSSTRRST